MNRPHDFSTSYRQKGIDLDSDRPYIRDEPPQGPQSGVNMMNRKMPNYREAMNDLNDGFDNMKMNSRKYSASDRLQSRRDPREPQGKADMRRRRINDMGGFDEN